MHTLPAPCFGYIPCYASEGSDVSEGAAVGRSVGDRPHVRWPCVVPGGRGLLRGRPIVHNGKSIGEGRDYKHFRSAYAES